jgi:hypothetical protein
VARWPWDHRRPRASGPGTIDIPTPPQAAAAARPADTFRLPVYPPPPPASDFGLELRLGWRRADERLEAGVKAFWARLNLLPPGLDPEQRVKEVILAAYAGDQLVAVATALIEEQPFLHCRMAVYRCAIDPAFRNQDISMLITAHSVLALETWSREHPDEAVMGVLAVLQAPGYQRKSHPHRAPETKLSLVGFSPRGDKIVVAWFAHALV